MTIGVINISNIFSYSMIIENLFQVLHLATVFKEKVGQLTTLSLITIFPFNEEKTYSKWP